MKSLSTPLSREKISKLRAGELVYLSGVIYTARDQAHKRLAKIIKQGKKLPLEVSGQIIYYCGPTATPKGKVIGSCGPTTSIRMDPFVAGLLKKGLKGMIGKGRRGDKVRGLIKKYKVVYFLAPSGCGAFIAGKVISQRPVAFPDLGPEAIVELKVKELPLIVGIDSRGKDIYRKGR
jgi:fumarate hydratase subunit beta